ncbi:HPr family phosphocarrier protein [Halalkalibacter alkalisediminis]|uniref:HPr family phosphocarrier protein n=1 Tax=Halalkalibacter alkalisediminis TaxID=935616 RepID=A0ABV6NP44_9BACI|nr:HPr family phosphocarrier protein [Halalkalibacter alkalisediminis]
MEIHVRIYSMKEMRIDQIVHLVSIAQKYSCDIFLCKNDRKTNCKGLLGTVMFFLSNQKSDFCISAIGPDSRVAARELINLFSGIKEIEVLKK